MELTDYLQLARRNWLVILALPLLLAIAAFVYTDRQPRVYAATTTVLVRATEQVSTAGTGSAEVNVATLPVLAKEARNPDVLTAAAGPSSAKASRTPNSTLL